VLKGDGVQVNNIKVIGLRAQNIDHIYRVERVLEDGEAVVDEARFSISKVGARQGLPTLDELTRRYRELYNEPL
jgi:hypothetical protein